MGLFSSAMPLSRHHAAARKMQEELGRGGQKPHPGGGLTQRSAVVRVAVAIQDDRDGDTQHRPETIRGDLSPHPSEVCVGAMVCKYFFPFEMHLLSGRVAHCMPVHWLPFHPVTVLQVCLNIVEKFDAHL